MRNLEGSADTLRYIQNIDVELAMAKARIEQLSAESAQWQESCGQNYVRACESEMREEKKDKRIDELEKLNLELKRTIGEFRAAIDKKLFKKTDHE